MITNKPYGLPLALASYKSLKPRGRAPWEGPVGEIDMTGELFSVYGVIYF